jgi:tRNA pseudouridine38-40 synthase
MELLNEPVHDGLVRIMFDLSYDGTNFAGWARQPDLRTVQGLLEDCLAMMLRVPVQLTCAGRTDAGVHARHQIVHFDLRESIWRELGAQLLRRLAHFLPSDVRVNTIGLAPIGFDARFSALRRHYRYRICDVLVGIDPLARINVLNWQAPLDEKLMNEASVPLLGKHDFAAFCKKREGATSIRQLEKFAWSRDENGLLVADVVADAFCHAMVRSLVGPVIAVGEGRRPVSWPLGMLQSGARSAESIVASPEGLTLERIDYPVPSELAARAIATRKMRELDN